MPIDSSLALQLKPLQLDNPMDIQAKGLTLRHLQQQSDQADRDIQSQRTLADLYKNNISPDGTVNNSGIFKGLSERGLGDKIPAYQKQMIEAKKLQTDADRGQVSLDAEKYKLAKDRIDRSMAIISALSSNPNTTRQDIVNHFIQQVKNNELPADMGSEAIKNIPEDPAQLKNYLENAKRKVLALNSHLEALLPKPYETKLGGTLERGNIDQITGKRTPTETIQLTPSPDALVSAGTSRANNAATISKDYAVAGINPDGTPSGAIESIAQLIAAGKMPPPSGFALSKPSSQATMARVMQINPNYDATTYGAKAAAAKAFSTGSQGNSLRSFAVAGQHLDQLGNLAAALDNGNIQLINQAKNAYKQQTGNNAPTNFDATKDIVSKEVVKAIVASGGGVAEREELSRLMSNAKSPAQLNGVIKQYRDLMQAQHDHLLEQRRAAGLDDSTLPNYSATPALAKKGNSQQVVPAIEPPMKGGVSRGSAPSSEDRANAVLKKLGIKK